MMQNIYFREVLNTGMMEWWNNACLPLRQENPEPSSIFLRRSPFGQHSNIPTVRKSTFQGTFLFFFLSVAGLLLFSCGEDEFAGYSKTETGLYYKLHSFSDDTIKPGSEDITEVQLCYMTEKDSVFFDTKNVSPNRGVYLHAGNSAFKGSFEEGIQRMSKGDSMVFLVNADSFFLRYVKAPLPYFFKQGDYVKVSAEMLNVYSPLAFSNHMAEVSKQEADRDMEEFKRLYRYVNDYHQGVQADSKGIYHIVIREGSGPVADTGRSVTVNYKGYFLNGNMFDKNYEAKPFEFTLGEDGQVIPGLALGIQKMKEGGKSKIIIPSYLGYGSEGSSTGIVPPFKTLVYEIELIKVK